MRDNISDDVAFLVYVVVGVIVSVLARSHWHWVGLVR